MANAVTAGSPKMNDAPLRHLPGIRVITIPGASYLTPNEEPALVAKLLLEALDQVHSDQQQPRVEHRDGKTSCGPGAI